MNNMGKATIKKKKGVTEKEKKVKTLMNPDVLAIFRVELQQRKLFCKKKLKQGCRNDRGYCILKPAFTHQFKATDVKHEILYMT